MSVKFEDNSIKVKESLKDAVKAFLFEAANEVRSQVADNTRVDTGQLKNSWEYKIDAEKGEARIGSPLENAIWEEFGTGEYALGGNGRKGGWRYQDGHGDWHFTKGKAPSRAFHSAYTSTKPKIIKRAEQVIGAKMNE